MSLERFFGKFDRAVVVRGGVVTQTDLLRPDGSSALRRTAKAAAPAAIVGVALSGAARPGETVGIVPGVYTGFPAVVLSYRLIRGGEDVLLTGLEIAITEDDLDRRIEVIEVATNPLGTTETRAAIEVARIAPAQIVPSHGGADVASDVELPLILTQLSADGTQPLSWTVEGAGAHVVINTDAVVPVLQLVSMPDENVHALSIRAANAAGEAEAAFVLNVTRPVLRAPGAVVLSAVDATVAADAGLPRVLARLSAGGTEPLDWSLEQADAWFALEQGDEALELRLIAMPEPGVETVAVRASNAAGTARAVFDLIVTEPVTAPGAVALSAQAARVTPHQALPVVLANVAADGSAPLIWTVEGSDALILTEEDGVVQLVLVAMPAPGDHAVRIIAENTAGSAEAAFALSVAVAQEPAQVRLSATAAEIGADATLPLVLAQVWADKAQDWSLSGGEGFAELVARGDGADLMLIAMPQAGVWPLHIAVGGGGADFMLSVTAEIKAPQAVSLSADTAVVVNDSALPRLLAVATADGSAPLNWTLTGGDGFAVLEQDGATGEMRLMLTRMPEPGAHELSLHAANDVGAAVTIFSLEVQAALMAPASVNLSAVQAEVRADAQLPLELAVAAADGTLPLNWSLTGPEGHVALDMAQAQVRLMLLSMPEPGDWPVVLRAANGAGAAEAELMLRIAAAEAPVVMPLTLSAGEAHDLRLLDDGGVGFSLSGTDHDGDYSIASAAIEAGHPVILRLPEATEGPVGTFTVTRDGLYAWPAADQVSVLIDWLVDGTLAGSGASFTRQALDMDAQIEMAVRLINIATVEHEAEVSARQTVQSETTFAPVPTRFNALENDAMQWNRTFENADAALLVTRFRFDPDAEDTDLRGNIVSLNSNLEVTVSNATGSLRVFLRTDPPAESATRGLRQTFLAPLPARGDLVDVIMGLGPHGANGARITYSAVRLNNGDWTHGAISVAEDRVIDLASSRGVRLGLGTTFNTAARVTHAHVRTAIWLGRSVSLDEAKAIFFRADGQ
ncbi:MAG: hypothetical protein Q4G49_05115, partial [Paracoccus sp. (in: a-proteobacteria)]|nr:hypothetical protein [Paracoccus sp. (in: a-proteobacteria)]